MKRLIILIVASLLAASSCATNAAAVSPGSEAFTGGLKDRDWILAEIRTGSEIISIERPDFMADSFTIRFEENRVSGMGAPNRFFGPYNQGAGNSISIGLLASTLMAALFELDDLKEHQYFAYLHRVSAWNIRNGLLELQAADENNTPVFLIYR